MVLEDRLVDALLDRRRAPPGLSACGWREVEAELVGPDGRAGLVDVVAEHLPQRLVEEVRRRVVRHRREADAPRARRPARGRRRRSPHPRRAAPGRPRAGTRRASSRARPVVLSRARRRRSPGRRPRGRTATRAAWRGRARRRRSSSAPICVSTSVFSQPTNSVVNPAPRAKSAACWTSPLPPPAREISRCSSISRSYPSSSTGEPALARELERQLDREAVRRLERERVLAADRAAGGRVLEQLHPALERLGEALLLGCEDAADLVAVLGQLRVRRRPSARSPRRRGRRGTASRMPDPQPVLDGAADDPPQDVAAALVRGRDAVADEERHPAAVVGEHAVRLRRVGRVAVRDAGRCRRSSP